MSASSSPLLFTEVSSISGIISSIRLKFASNITKDIQWRLENLRGLLRLVTENEKIICNAITADIGRSYFDAWFYEILQIEMELKYVISNLSSWMKPEFKSVPIWQQPGQAYVIREPLGTVLIIGAWNFPFTLCLSPLIGAIAAGNCCVLKPSEVAQNAATLLQQLLPRYVDSSAIVCIQGGAIETGVLLKQKFDHIFYTGNGAVGRLVLEAAAPFLTPVTLELGGKNPTYVDENSNIDVAARRIVWGKFCNCGQVCIAPDYVLVHQSVAESFCKLILETIKEFYGDNPRLSRDYSRIINEKHVQRLANLIKSGDLKKGKILCGGKYDIDSRYFEPTVLLNPEPDACVMKDEIFGPILPIIIVKSVNDAVRFIIERPKPLAINIFSHDIDVIEMIQSLTSSGTMVVNDSIMQFGVLSLPFGGVGASGLGVYRGRHSFDTFSNQKSVLKKSDSKIVDKFIVGIRNPPMSERTKMLLRRGLSML